MTEGQLPLTSVSPAADGAAVIAIGAPPLTPIAENAVSAPADPASVEKPTNIRYTVLAWACSLSMLTYIDRVCISNVGGTMQEDLGISKTEFGLVFGGFGLAYALFEVPSGWLGDRFGPRLVLPAHRAVVVLFHGVDGLRLEV